MTPTRHPRRIGILGGTFDPIHRGHLDVGDAAVRELDLKRLLVVTSHVPPHRPQPFASAFHRFAMVSMAVAGRSGWRASDVELRTPALSYTSSTLKRFHERGYAAGELFVVLGADAFAEIETWHDYPGILGDAHFVAVSRPGFSCDRLRRHLASLSGRMVEPPTDAHSRSEPSIILIETPTADVSSTTIRQRCNAGVPITGLVPPGVQQHIEQHALYRSTALQSGSMHDED